MMRLSYKTNKKGYLVSAQKLISKVNGAEYKVIIDTTKLTYRIYNVNSRRNVKFGSKKVNNMQVVYRNIRRDLRILGVELEFELRRV